MHTKESEWTPAETALLLSLVQSGKEPEACYQEFLAAGIPNRSKQSVRRKIQREQMVDPVRWQTIISTSPKPRYNDPLTLTGDALIIHDPHCPYHDAGFLNRCKGLALKWGIKKLGIGGDWADFYAFSMFCPEGEKPDAEEEIELLGKTLDELCSDFSETVICMGNHDARLPKLLQGKLGIKTLSQMWIKRNDVQVSQYYWFRLVSGDVLYHIEHPKNASAKATLVPIELCAIHDCSVIAGHGHKFGLARDKSGKHWAIDSGVTADPKRLAYENLRHSTRGMSQQGCVIIKDGVPILLSPSNLSLYETMRI